MRVNLRGRDARVAEHLLHLAQVSSAGKQMRSKTMRMECGLKSAEHPASFA